MPELPEVENVKIQLNKKLQDLRFQLMAVEWVGKPLRKSPSAQEFHSLLGQKLLGVSRRAKYLLFRFETSILLNSLGMSGSWKANPQSTVLHDHFVFKFKNTNSDFLKLVYNDPRRFGFFEIHKTWQHLESAKNLGPEPLESEPAFLQKHLQKFFKAKTQNVKSALMNPLAVVGVGNIYASEILFHAGIRPQKNAGRLKSKQVQRLVQSLQSVLREAVDRGGSTIRDFKSLDSILGNYQDQHFVYGRASKPCRICGSPIRKTVQAGRSTFWCQHCQK